MTKAEAAAILEVSLPASKEALKKAYRQSLLVWHPDRFPGNEELRLKATEKTRKINEAYRTLCELVDTGPIKSPASSCENPVPKPEATQPKQTQPPNPRSNHSDRPEASPHASAAGVSTLLWLLAAGTILIVWLVIFTGLESGKSREYAQPPTEHSNAKIYQKTATGSPPRSVAFDFPTAQPRVRVDCILPSGWIAQAHSQPEIALLHTNPNESRSVTVRFMVLNGTELEGIRRWSSSLAVLSNGTPLREQDYTHLLPGDVQLRSVTKNQINWKPTLEATWEKRNSGGQSSYFLCSKVHYLYLNQCLISIEFTTGGMGRSTDVQLVRERFTEALPEFEAIASSIELKEVLPQASDIKAVISLMGSLGNKDDPGHYAKPSELPLQAPPLPSSQYTLPVPATKMLKDLKGRTFEVPERDYNRLVKLREEALKDRKRVRKVTPDLEDEQRRIAEEEKRLDKAIAKTRGKNDPHIVRWIYDFDAKKREAMGRWNRAVSPFSLDTCLFQLEIERVGKLSK